MASSDISVHGQHLSPESRSRTAHLEEVIQQANVDLCNPESVVPHFPELAALQSLHLDSNHKFVILRRQLERFLVQQRSGTQGEMHPGKSQKWVEVLYSSLTTALFELTFSADREQQDSDLARVFEWFAEKTKFTQQLPRLRKDSEVLLAPRTATVRQNNSMHARRERLLLRKLDEYMPIESRSQSPAKSPPLPIAVGVDRTKSFQSSVKPREGSISELEKRCVERVTTWQKRGMDEYRGQRMTEKIVHEWSVRRAKQEEQFVARAELRSFRPRVSTVRRSPDSETNPAYTQPSPRDTSTEQTADSARGCSYYDFREKSESPIRTRCITRERIVQSRIERLRMMTGIRSDSKEDVRGEWTSLSGFTPQPGGDLTPCGAGPLVASIGPGTTTEEHTQQTAQMASIRRKLATSQVPCSFQTLISGLHRPSELSSISPSFLPQGGEYLLHNPFSTLGRKKKKGKKGRKKNS